MPKRKCNYATSLVIHEYKYLGITHMQCTWICGKSFWMLKDGLLSREITLDEVAKILVRLR